jgi:adenylyltransferase/sulfurtransferase
MKRYVRNIVLDEIGFEGQEKLNNTTALVIGVGGLGCHLINHLVSLGVGSIVLIDHDIVSISNLQRQNLFQESDIGKLKVDRAKINIEKYNSKIKIFPISLKFSNSTNFIKLFNKKIDIAFDCTDNYESRFDISQFCTKHKINLISASVTKFEGWVLNQEYKNSLRFENVFEKHSEDFNCDTTGVTSPSVGFVSSIQSMEGLKVILDLNRDKNTLLQINCMIYEVYKMRFGE